MRYNNIFFSYGRDTKNPQHILKIKDIKAFLEEKSFNVFMDTRELIPGKEWDTVLEEGIKVSDCIIYFVTPYSARRPDSFCFNEIAFALSLRKKVIPIILSSAILPISICRLQYLNIEQLEGKTLDRKLDELSDYLKGEQTQAFEGSQLSLYQKINPPKYQAMVAKYLYGFIGREWVYNDVNEWLTKSSRILWITADAGYGKTALSTYLTNHQSCIGIHYCQYDSKVSQNPNEMLRNFVYGLSTQLPNYHDRLLTLDIEGTFNKNDAVYTIKELVIDPLYQLQAPSKKVFFIIDALDEAQQGEANPLLDFITRHFVDLPKWLNIIITSRNEQRLFKRPFAYDLQKLFVDEENNKKDIYLYIKQYFSNLDESIMASFVKKCEGNFLYLKLLVESLKGKNFEKNDIEQLPEGVNGFYQTYFERKYPDLQEYESDILPFINLLVASQVGLPKALIQTLLGIDDRTYNKKITYHFGSLLEIKEGKVTFYHKSLFDWLLNSEKSWEYTANISKGLDTLSSKLWFFYKKGKGKELKYETHLLQVLEKGKKDKKLFKVLKDILFIGKLYDEKEQYLYLNILDNILKRLRSIKKRELLQEYALFFREKGHFIKYNEDLDTKPHIQLFQLAYEDGDNSPLSQYCDILLEENRIDFDWFKNLQRPKFFFREDRVKILQGHISRINGAILLKDGRILSFSIDKTMRIWSKQGTCLKTIYGHEKSINEVIELEKEILVSFHKDYSVSEICVWSLSGSLLNKYNGMKAFSNSKYAKLKQVHRPMIDDRKLNIIRNIKNLTSEEVLNPLHSSSYIQGYITLGNNQILLVLDDNVMHICKNTKELAFIRDIKVLKNNYILFLKDHALNIYTNNGILVKKLSKPIIAIKENILELNNNTIVVISLCKMFLYIFSLQGKLLKTLKIHTDVINGLIVLKNSKFLSFSDDGFLLIWSYDGKLISKLNHAKNNNKHAFENKYINPKKIYKAIELKNGDIISFCEYGRPKLWSSNGVFIKELPIIDDNIVELSDGTIAYGGQCSNVEIYSLQKDTVISTVSSSHNTVEIKELKNGDLLLWGEHDMFGVLVVTQNGESIQFSDSCYFSNKNVKQLNNGNIVLFPIRHYIHIYTIKGELIGVIEGKDLIELSNNKLLTYFNNGTIRIFNGQGFHEKTFILPVPIINIHSINKNKIIGFDNDQLYVYALQRGNTSIFFEEINNKPDIR